jgi:site-specific recombinase XerD
MQKINIHKSGNPLAVYLKSYLENLKASKRSENTIYTYYRILNFLINYIHAAYRVGDAKDIKGFMIEAFMKQVTDISESTRNYYITVINLFFTYLVEADYIDRNPAGVLRKTKVVVDDEEDVEVSDAKIYSNREIMTLMRSCRGNNSTRDRAIIAMLMGTGMRASELCSLDIRDWRSMQNGHIYVKRKGGAYKWIAVATFVNPYIEMYLAERPGAGKDEPLFVSENGNRLTRQSLYKILKARQDRIGVKPGVHIFRHTFLTGSAKASDLRTAQALANHHDVATTMGYVHSTSDERINVVNSTEWASGMVQSVNE